MDKDYDKLMKAYIVTVTELYSYMRLEKELTPSQAVCSLNRVAEHSIRAEEEVIKEYV